MKAAKIFAGILQLPIAIFIVFQTYSARSQVITTDTIQSIVYSAFVIASCYLITGIINLLSTQTKHLAPDIIYAILLLVGWFFARNDTAGFKFLNLWAWIGLILGLAILIAHIVLAKLGYYDQTTTQENATQEGSRRTGNATTRAHRQPSAEQQKPWQPAQPTQSPNSYNAPYPPQSYGYDPYQNPQNQMPTRQRQSRPATEPLPSRAQLRAKKGRRSRK